jgi:hypothetical protein
MEHFDCTVLAKLPKLTTLSLPPVSVHQWAQVVASCPQLVALERGFLYDHTMELQNLSRFEFPGLRELVVARPAYMTVESLADLAHTCPELRKLEVSVEGRHDYSINRCVGVEYSWLERLHVTMAGGDDQHTLNQMCKFRFPHLRWLRLAAALEDLRPLSVFSTLQVLDVRRCNVYVEEDDDTTRRDAENSTNASTRNVSTNGHFVIPHLANGIQHHDRSIRFVGFFVSFAAYVRNQLRRLTRAHVRKKKTSHLPKR